MQRIITSILAVAFSITLAACAHRYYLGFHGPTIKTFPDIHRAVVEDDECLGCHGDGDQSQGPPTSHPQFKGCLKCHND